MSIYKKFLLSFLTFFVLLLSFARYSPVSAEGSWYNVNPTEFYSKVFDDSNPSEIFGERYTAAQVQWVFWSLGALIINVGTGGHSQIFNCAVNKDIATCAIELTKAVQDLKSVFAPQTTGSSETKVSTLANVVGRSPISGIAYTKNLISKFDLVPEVQAQGFGFTTGANAVQSLWRVSRNICFALLTLIIIIFSFMIMFRVKINPQTVITVQSAIPKLFGALILITFSYALAGFAIDLMYVVIGLLASFISGSHLSEFGATELFKEFTTGENAIWLLFKFWLAFFYTSIWSIGSSVNPVTWLGGLLLTLFAIITLLISIWFSFKMIALIFKTFASIVLTIVTGPFEILFGTVMQGMGFGQWFRKLLGHLAVYPVMALMFFLAFFFLAQSLNQGLSGWVTSFGDNYVEIFPFNPSRTQITGNTWDPPLSTFMVDGDALLWAILGFVIFTMIPKTAEIIQGFISGRPFAYGSAIGEAMNPVNYVKNQAWRTYGAPVSGALANASAGAVLTRFVPEGGTVDALLDRLSNGVWRKNAQRILEDAGRK